MIDLLIQWIEPPLAMNSELGGAVQQARSVPAETIADFSALFAVRHCRPHALALHLQQASQAFLWPVTQASAATRLPGAANSTMAHSSAR
jgi:hypothetical protein